MQHDPLQKIEIGPGGTFGLDPLEQLNHREYPAPQPEPQPQEESFELHLEPEAQQAEEAPVEEESLNDLIQRAVTGRDTPWPVPMWACPMRMKRKVLKPR